MDHMSEIIRVLKQMKEEECQLRSTKENLERQLEIEQQKSLAVKRIINELQSELTTMNSESKRRNIQRPMDLLVGSSTGNYRSSATPVQVIHLTKLF